MGKRKKSSRGPKGPKKREPLATAFQCLFCNHEKSVTVKLHKKEGIGELSCRVCGQSYQTTIHWLSAAVDVYSDWIDACEAVANGDSADAVGLTARESYRDVDVTSHAVPARSSGVGGGSGGRAAKHQDEDDLDGFIEQDDENNEGVFADDGGIDDDDDD